MTLSGKLGLLAKYTILSILIIVFLIIFAIIFGFLLAAKVPLIPAFIGTLILALLVILAAYGNDMIKRNRIMKKEYAKEMARLKARKDYKKERDKEQGKNGEPKES